MNSDGPKRQADGGHAGQRKKAKFHQKGSGQAIPHGSRGILVTCDNGREMKAFYEVVQLLEEYHDKLSKPASGKVETATEGPKDVSAMLAQEVAQLKDKKTHKFQQHNTQVGGTIFVLFPEAPEHPGPVEVVEAIMRDLKSSMVPRTRYTLRMLPITNTCFANMDSIKDLSAKLMPESFPTEGPGHEFSVEYEHRSQNNLERMLVINAFAEAVPKPPHRVNLNKPQRTILVQATRNVVGVSIVPSYKDLAKFNVRKITEPPEEDAANPKPKTQLGGDKPAAAGQPSSTGEVAAAATAEAGAVEAGGTDGVGQGTAEAGDVAVEAVEAAGVVDEAGEAALVDPGPDPEVTQLADPTTDSTTAAADA